MKKLTQATWEEIFAPIDADEILYSVMPLEEDGTCEPLVPYLITEESIEQECFAPITPILKWAGGKSQLLSQMVPHFPASFENYHEPFLGGGAVFFFLAPTKGKKSWLSDVNAELINFYQIVHDQIAAFIATVCAFDKRYRAASHETQKTLFYQIRNLDRTLDFDDMPPFQRAVRFYVLNKTAYNGLYRTNQKGQFNVPWGRYNRPSLCAQQQLFDASEVLRRFGVWLKNTSFEAVLDNAQPNDFVYFDPPYVPLSATASFTAYTPEGFNAEAQKKLADVCYELDRRGIQFMLSNSDTTFIHDLYAKFNITKLQARRSINCNGNGRGPISELLITNY